MIHPAVGVLERAKNDTLLRIGGDDLDWIARYLASLDCRFTILDPPELVDAVRALAARLAEDAAAHAGEDAMRGSDCPRRQEHDFMT
jgi:hypothetical protein